MDDGIKQRLIGAVVLVMAAVIFIPMLFDDVQTRPEDIRQSLPPSPDVPKLEFKQPQPPTLPPEPVAEPDTSETANTGSNAGSKTGNDTKTRAMAWTVQLASFKQMENAEALRDRLRKAGYKSYIKYRPQQTPALIRVFVGPVLSKGDGERLIKALKKDYQLQGIIAEYLP